MGRHFDPGESLRYQMLLTQYEQCMERFGGARFASHAFNDTGLLDTPEAPRDNRW